MPIPKTTDVGKILRFLKKENPSMSQKRRLAIALNSVRSETERRTENARVKAIQQIKKK